MYLGKTLRADDLWGRTFEFGDVGWGEERATPFTLP